MFPNNLIVIVDDSQDIRDMLKIKLNCEGYNNIVTYDNPLCLIEDVKNGLKPAILFTDYNMSWLTGYELLEIISGIEPSMQGIIITATDRLPKEISDKYIILGKDTSRFCNIIADIVKDKIPNYIHSGDNG
jgi:DNA-binding NtrC family response regulator